MVHQPRSLAKPHSHGNAPIARIMIAIAWLVVTAPTLRAAPPSGTPRGVDPSAIVLTVGPIKVSMLELKQAFDYAAAADTSTLRPDATSARRFVDSYVPTLLAQAYTARDTTLLRPSDLNSIGLYKETLSRAYLRDQLVPKHVRTDEKILRQTYENMKTQLNLAVIRVPTLVEVDAVRADLARGIDFQDVARTRSRDQATTRSGGALGWMDAIRFLPEQQEILWSLPVGAVSQTINSPSYYSIYKILGRRDGPPLRDFETEKPGIILAVSKSQLARAGAEIHDELLASYHYRIDPDAAEWMRAFLHKETATARRTLDPTYEKSTIRIGEPTEKPFWSEAPLKGDDARRPVAFIDGDTLHAIEVIDQLVFAPTIVWPLFEHVGDVNDLCDEAIYERVQLREALRLGVNEDPEFNRKMTNRRALVAWRSYRRQVLLPKITPTEAELQALYNRTITRFRIPERRRYVAIGGPTIDIARRAADLLRSGMAPTTIGRQIQAEAPALLIEATPDTGMGLVRRGDTPDLDKVIFGLAKGQVSDPVPDRGGYAVLRVDEILPPRTQSFEEVRLLLENEAIAPRERAAIEEIARQAAPMFKVSIDQAAISKMDFNLSVFEQREKRRRP